MTKEQEEKMKMLELQVKELEEKVAELDNNWKRALADYRNLQKRTEEEKQAFIEFTCLLNARRMLPILDNLEALEKLSNDESLKLIVKEFKRTLSDEEIFEIEALGKDFDAQTMEAIEIVEGQENKVMEVLNKGYMFRNKLLVRPARVKVGSTKKEEK